MRFHEIPREILPQLSQNDPDNKDDPNDKNTILNPPLPISQNNSTDIKFINYNHP